VGKGHATSLNTQFSYCTLLHAMYTGIVQALGARLSVRPSMLAIKIPSYLRARLDIGGRIAVTDVCLSVIEVLLHVFAEIASAGRRIVNQTGPAVIPQLDVRNLGEDHERMMHVVHSN